MSANFDPSMGNYKNMTPFKMWCQKVLPQTYDDSLSYYEVLCKLKNHLNEVIENMDVLHDDVDALHVAYQQLEGYVNNYFDNLSVQTEINNKLDDMAEDGSLSELIAPFVETLLPDEVAERIESVVALQLGAVVAQQLGAVVGEQLPDEVATQVPTMVSAWLDDHVNPESEVVIDDSLTIQGAAADAKAAGDAIGELKSALTELEDEIEEITESKNLFNKEEVVDHAWSMSGSTGKVSGNSNCKSIMFDCEGNTSYAISKSVGERLVAGYFQNEPTTGETSDGFVASSNNGKSVVITTNATAQYLVVFCYNSDVDTEITYQDVLNALQIEEGSTVTPYEPYHLSAIDTVCRNKVDSVLNGGYKFEKLYGKLLDVSPVHTSPAYGSELTPAISTFTSDNGATYADGVWTLDNSQSIKTTVTVVSGEVYHCSVKFVDGSEVWKRNQPNHFTIKLGTASAEFFYAHDKNTVNDIVALEDGAVTVEYLMGADASGEIESVSIKKINRLASDSGNISSFGIEANSNNIAIGNGQTHLSSGDRNTAFGYEAQKEIETGKGNTAYGYQAQRDVVNGSYNTAFGEFAQKSLTTGMYNVAVGHVAQDAITDGCWNVAMGIEAQGTMTKGCNNVTIGRRAHYRLTTGCCNTAVGSQAGFVNGLIPTGEDTTGRTTTADFQTTVGFNATQTKSNLMVQKDYATSFGAFAQAGKYATALGPKTVANGDGSVAIGCDSDGNGANTTTDNQIAIGTVNHSIVLAGRKINFNNDGTVTWEAL